MNPVHTACISKAAPRVMPSWACTLVAVAGKVWSGVAVASTMRSRSPPAMPADLSAWRAAAVARSEVSSPTAATWRCRMPVRCTIHSSEVARRSARSALVTIFSGRYPPQPRISERNAISDCGRLRFGERAMRVEPCKLLADLVEETVRLHIDRDRDGIGETERIGAAMTLHGDALQA